jgi:hypothetical protein
MKKYFVICVICVICGCLSAPGLAQNGKPADKSVLFREGGDDVARSTSADKPPAPVPLDEEVRELLNDRQLVLNEIARIETLECGGSTPPCSIPVSLRELRRRDAVKLGKFLAWLDANKIPREWGKAGWTFADGKFIPPAPPKADVAPGGEAAPAKKP